jgi:hypothetical protein
VIINSAKGTKNTKLGPMDLMVQQKSKKWHFLKDFATLHEYKAISHLPSKIIKYFGHQITM